MNYRALNITHKWPKHRGSFNAQLVPKKLEALAKAGAYFDDRMI